MLAPRFPALSQRQCLDSMQVVREDGRIYEGFEGYRALAWAIPLWWPALPILYLPGVPAIGRAVYSRVTISRHVAGCPVPH